jgi:hypothetical protein
VTEAVQKPSETPLVIYGPCARQASTYQLRPLPSCQRRSRPAVADDGWPAAAWIAHREAASRMRAGGDDEVAEFGHPVHGARGLTWAASVRM